MWIGGQNWWLTIHHIVGEFQFVYSLEGRFLTHSPWIVTGAHDCIQWCLLRPHIFEYTGEKNASYTTATVILIHCHYLAIETMINVRIQIEYVELRVNVIEKFQNFFELLMLAFLRLTHRHFSGCLQLQWFKIFTLWYALVLWMSGEKSYRSIHDSIQNHTDDFTVSINCLEWTIVGQWFYRKLLQLLTIDANVQSYVHRFTLLLEEQIEWASSICCGWTMNFISSIFLFNGLYYWTLTLKMNVHFTIFWTRSVRENFRLLSAPANWTCRVFSLN